MTLATSPEPEAWRLQVRGDLFHWGKLGPQRVPFEEFLRTRLEAYGEVRMIPEAPSKPGAEPSDSEASMVVMPVGVPLASDVLNRVAALGARMPVLLLLQPLGRRPLQRWPVLARQLRDRGVALPAVDNLSRMLGMLHRVNGENAVYVTQKRNQWAYIAAMHEAFRAPTQPPHQSAAQSRRSAPSDVLDGLLIVTVRFRPWLRNCWSVFSRR